MRSYSVIIIGRRKKSANICECAGIGRQARLRGVCPRRTGSSPVTRTKIQNRPFGLFWIFYLDETGLEKGGRESDSNLSVNGC